MGRLATILRIGDMIKKDKTKEERMLYISSKCVAKQERNK